MIRELALTSMLGLPAVAWGGMATLFLLLFTATVSFLNKRGNHTIPFSWHPKLAVLTITLALIHGFFGMALVMGF